MFDLLAAAREIHDATAFERWVLERLRSLVAYDAAFLAMKGDRPTTIDVDAAKLDAALGSADYAAEISPLKAAALAGGGLAVDTCVLGERAVRKLSYHRDFVAPVGGRHTLLAFLSLRGRIVGGLMLGRSGRTFTSVELERIRALLPDLTMARVSFRAPWYPAALGGVSPAGLWSRCRERAGVAQLLDRVDVRGQTIEIRDRGRHREMVAISQQGEFIWSRADRRSPRQSGWFYVDLFHLAAVRAKERSKVLLIGCGGAVAAHQFATLYPGSSLDIVESDASVVELARRWYGLGEIPNVSIIVDDGRAILARVREPTWDVVVVDAYDASELATGFTQSAFFVDLRRALRPGGCFAFNVVGALSGKGPVREVERAARRIFDDVRLVPVLDAGESYSPSAIRNVVVLGRTEDG
jgi:spermidine synthase